MHTFLSIFLLSITITTAESTTRAPIHSRSITPNYKPEVINELKDFLNLIPQTTIDEIVAKHFVIDGDFRHAVKFLRSNDFKQLILHAEELPEILEILNFLHLLTENDDAHDQYQQTDRQTFCEFKRQQLENTIDNIPVQIELLPYSGEDTVVRHFRSFTSFVEELLEHLPRNSYVSMIEEKRQRNADFAEFYKALRSSNFQQMADAAMNTVNVAKIVQTLSSHNIDPKGLEAIGLRVISWGPSA